MRVEIRLERWRLMYLGEARVENVCSIVFIQSLKPCF